MNPKLADKEYCKNQGIPVIDDYVKMYSDKIEIDLTLKNGIYILLTIFSNLPEYFKVFLEELEMELQRMKMQLREQVVSKLI